MPLTVRVPWLTLAGAAVAIVLAFFPGTAGALEWDRAALAQGEYWRLVSGHFAHWSASHFAWDTLAFLVCGGVVELHSRRLLVAASSLAAFVVSVALLALTPGLERYRGLSGIDSALFMVVLAIIAQRAWRVRSLLSLTIVGAATCGFWAKIAFELTAGHSLFVRTDSTILTMPHAHAIGAIAGITVVLLGLACERILTPKREGGAGLLLPDAAPCPAGGPPSRNDGRRRIPDQNS